MIFLLAVAEELEQLVQMVLAANQELAVMVQQVLLLVHQLPTQAAVAVADIAVAHHVQLLQV